MKKLSIREIAYNRYRFNWMLERGYNIETLLELLNKYKKETDSDNRNLLDLFSDWEYECGFNGECYVSYDEFIGNEWTDRYYMFELLDKEEYQMYLEERGL